MESYKKVCLVAPERWAASVALALRAQFTSASVVCVGDARTNDLCLNLGIATETTEELSLGLKDADLILLGQRDSSPDRSVQNVLQACEKNATICGYGHSVTGVSNLAVESNRGDVHYVGARIQGSWDPSADVSTASAADIQGHVLNLTPASIDDLDAMSALQRYFQTIGARVAMLSPKAHDRQRAEDIYLPKLILLPLVHYLAEASRGKERSLAPENVRLLESFGTLTEENSSELTSELLKNKQYLLPALDAYQNDLLLLKEGLATGHIQEPVINLAREIATLMSEVKAVGMSENNLLQSTENLSPEALAQVVDSLLVAVDKIETSTSASTTTDIHAVQKLLEQTHQVLAHLTRANPVAQTVEAAVKAVESPAEVEAVGVELLTAAIQHEAESDIPSFAEVAATQSPEFASGTTEWDAPAETLPESDLANLDTGYYQDKLISLDIPSDNASQAPLAEAPAFQPFAEDESSASAPESWDIRVHDRPELQVMQRMSRLLASARIVIRNVERGVNADGSNILCISLANPTQTERACELLRRAGMSLE